MQPSGRALINASVDAFAVGLLLDVLELVVLRISARVAKGTELVLLKAAADDQVSEDCVLGLVGEARALDVQVLVFISESTHHVTASEGARRDGCKLACLQEECIASLLLDVGLDEHDVVHGGVIANNRCVCAHLVVKVHPGLPIVVLDEVLEGD